MVKGLSQKVYGFLSEDVLLIHNKYLKWMQDLGPNFVESLCDFGTIHSDIFRITNVPKYRSFQYRLLQRGLVTNIQLNKWNNKPSDLCYYCKEFKETLVHLFFECQIVKGFWTEIGDYIKSKYHYQINMTAANIILNRVIEKKNHVINFLVLLAKQYIYSQRCLGTRLGDNWF